METTYAQCGFYYDSELAVWNSPPSDLHDVTDSNTFKTRMWANAQRDGWSPCRI